MTNTPDAWKQSAIAEFDKILDKLLDVYYLYERNLVISREWSDSLDDNGWRTSNVTFCRYSEHDIEEYKTHQLQIKALCKSVGCILDAVGLAGYEQLRVDVLHTLLDKKKEHEKDASL